MAPENNFRPWLNMRPPGGEYLEPRYYDRILPLYSFGGSTDLIHLAEFVRGLRFRPQSVLELGPGSGRATQVLLDALPDVKYTGVDLSDRMIRASANRFVSRQERLRWITQDSVAFLEHGGDSYDLIVSLWSISHAIHQSIARTGSCKEAEGAITHLFSDRLAECGHVFIIHFDSCSDEQLISLAQRRRLWPFLSPNIPSPSQQVFERVLAKLEASGRWRTASTRLVGDVIAYDTLDSALESFMNFHMEGWFNQRPERDDVMQELTVQLLERRGADGKIRVVPGCLVFTAEKVGTRTTSP